MKATLDAQPTIELSGMTTHATDARVTQRALSNFHIMFAAAILFLLPNAIFAFALRPAPAAMVLAGCAGVVALLRRPMRIGALLSAPLDLSVYAGCFALALLLCMVGGEGHFFYATTDWITRDAVLADLVNNGLTVVYHWQNQDFLLRAPLGMYLVPAMAGRIFGLYAAHMALLAQNSFIIATVGYFAVQLANVRKLPMLLLLLAFSGMDIVPILLTEIVSYAKFGAFVPFMHIEWWGVNFSTILLQYSSHLTQLFWVPNHMAPGWWFTTLAFLYVRREIDFATLAASSAALLMWSPLAMMGAAPFILLFALELLPRRIFEARNLLAASAGLCFLPIAVYLTLDAAAVPHRFLLNVDGFLPFYLLFIMVEIPQVAIIAMAWDKVAPTDRRLVWLAVAMLLAIPTYSVGTSNDFVMRASIPPLFVLAFVFARVVALTPRDNGRFATAISVMVILSFATPMLEITQAMIRPSYAISDCNMVTSWAKGDPSVLPMNYWARVEKIPAWLMTADTPALLAENRRCWPDHPTIDEKSK